jgi:hypothetical protein
MTHDPQVGRPAKNLPEWMIRRADSWSTESVVIDRTSVSSSTIPAVCGNNSDSSIPAFPRFSNLNGEARSLPCCVWKWTSSFAVLLGEFRLGVEQVHLRRPAVLEQANDGLGLRREV